MERINKYWKNTQQSDTNNDLSGNVSTKLNIPIRDESNIQHEKPLIQLVYFLLNHGN